MTATAIRAAFLTAVLLVGAGVGTLAMLEGAWAFLYVLGGVVVVAIAARVAGVLLYLDEGRDGPG